jgi:hypothetical protein
MSESSNLLLLAFAAGVGTYLFVNWDKLQKSRPVADRPIPQNPPLERPIEMSASRNNPIMPPAAAPMNREEEWRERLRHIFPSGKTFLE